FESGRGYWISDGCSHGGTLVDPSARGADSARSPGSSPGESTDRDIDQQAESSVSEAESPGSNPGVPTVGKTPCSTIGRSPSPHPGRRGSIPVRGTVGGNGDACSLGREPVLQTGCVGSIPTVSTLSDGPAPSGAS